jgi:hypothetical protein
MKGGGFGDALKSVFKTIGRSLGVVKEDAAATTAATTAAAVAAAMPAASPVAKTVVTTPAVTAAPVVTAAPKPNSVFNAMMPSGNNNMRKTPNSRNNMARENIATRIGNYAGNDPQGVRNMMMMEGPKYQGGKRRRSRKNSRRNRRRFH